MKSFHDTGIYMIIGKGVVAESHIVERMKSVGVKNVEEALKVLRKDGRWTDGKVKIMTVK